MKKLISILLMSILSLSFCWSKSLFLTHDQLLEMWNEDQQSNQGYVWTININSCTMISVENLVEVNYAINLSMSHIGPTCHGVYKGVMGIAASRDTKEFEELLSLIGGKLTTSGDIDEVSSDEYVMVMYPYDAEGDEVWQNYFGYNALTFGRSQMVQDMINDVMDSFMGSYVRREKPFEKTMKPVSQGCGFELPPGSIGSFQEAQLSINNGYFKGTIFGEADLGVTNEKDRIEKGWGKVTDFLGSTYNASYDKNTICPFPHTISIYPNHIVVFELFSAEGGPITAKFYGTIDKIPVGQTIPATKKSMDESQKTDPTDDSPELQKKEAQVVLKARADERQAVEAEAQRQKEEAEREEMENSDVEVLKTLKEKFPMFPKWEGGSDYSIYQEENFATLSVTTDTDLIPDYCKRLRAAGFKLQTAKSKFDDNLYDLYKVIDGVYYGFMPDQNGSFVDGRNEMIFYILDEDQIKYVKENGEK